MHQSNRLARFRHCPLVCIGQQALLWLWGATFLLAAGQTRADDLAVQMNAAIAGHRGTVAVAVKHLPSGTTFEHRADEPMPTASLIKFPVMIEAYRQAEEGRVQLQQMVTLRDEDKVPGSGILTPHFSSGTQLSLRDAIRLMIAYSDNTATNLVLDQIGIASTAATMEQMGLPHTKLHAKVFRRDTSAFPERSSEFGLGSTTANEMLRLYEKLHQGQLVSPKACEEMLQHLSACQDKDKLVRGLPPGVRVAHKTGSVSQVRCDAGIVYATSGPLVICVLTKDNEDHRFDAENEAERLCGRLARIAYEHFDAGTETSGDAADAVLAEGASGSRVEILQRTLNYRLRPSPELSVDGDFGPQTRSAVVRFQQEQGLPADGQVNEATWKALGPVVTAAEPVPPPGEVNALQLPRRSADGLDGVPFVTAKAWAIADRQSGAILWGDQLDTPLDMASTTKVMTAYVVLQLAQQEPAVLDEVIEFSHRADQTRGSTAGVMAGERLPVREVLYGLLLPSGNDASVALAEHFGARCAAADAGESADPLQQFVAHMNRTADALGMEHTHFCNPHGLTERGHQASVRDLVRLAYAAWQDPLFRQIVGTRQRGATVQGPGGYGRHLLWKNTNRLLPIEGYEGIKTGTTDAAGACLISTASRDRRQLLMVVLGSQSSDARYVDSRNLYRWAWNQLQHSAGE